MLEPAALLATTLMTIAGFFAFCSLVRPYVANPFQAVLFGAVAYLGSPLEGVLGLLLSWQHGILLFAPVLILSVFCVRRWFREHQRDAILMSAAVVSYGLLMGSSLQWWGGTCYSAKLLIPVLPLMLAPMAMIGSSRWWNDHGRAFAAIVLLMVISVEFGAVAAFACEHINGKHAVQLVW